MPNNLRQRDKFVRTLSPRQKWPRNVDLDLRPKWFRLFTNAPFPSNVLYGRPRTIDRDPYNPPVPANTTPPVIVSDVTTPGGICSLDTAGVWTNEPTSYTYQWMVNDAPVEGETDPESFDTTALEADDEVTLQETAISSRGIGEPVLSNVITITAV
jgi:hypothetical protein